MCDRPPGLLGWAFGPRNSMKNLVGQPILAAAAFQAAFLSCGSLSGDGVTLSSATVFRPCRRLVTWQGLDAPQNDGDIITVGPYPPRRMQISHGVTDLAEHVQVQLASLPDPASAIRFLGRLRQESSGGFERIYGSPAALRCALHIFSYSNFLSEACLKNPEALWEASRPGALERIYSRDDYRQQLEQSLGLGVPT